MANNQTMNISLKFNADTQEARKEIRSLMTELTNLTNKQTISGETGNLSKGYKEATVEASKFVGILKSAVNIDTGKLDLSKLNAGLQESNMSLKTVASAFKALGAEGVKNFASIVDQINAAEVPLKQTNKLVDKLWLSFKNTVNWQLSSSAVHALVGGFQSAFRYAEDLNESLNNIRIVSGYSADKMADFAKEANKAAKALSTTTVDYTDAALIYYQQGNGQFLNFFVDKIF